MTPPRQPYLSTLDINQRTPAVVALRYDCNTCEHTFSVLHGEREEVCPGCDALIPCRPVKFEADLL